MKIFSIFPSSIKKQILNLKKLALILFYYGSERICPICNKSSRKFRSAGIIPREDAQCVHCGSLERHRFLWLYLTQKTDIFNDVPKKMLHVAPESCFVPHFQQALKKGYLTADLFASDVMVKMDITNIQYTDNYFDIICCNHVLEHVLDDKKALKEFFRVLKPSGWAILLVPITAAKTFEDPSITTPQERLRVFGQEDHVRIYGPDYLDRLLEVGFKVDVIKVNEFVSSDQANLMGLTLASGDIYFCKK